MNDIRYVLKQGAKLALQHWNLEAENHPELEQDLWVWYLESPSVTKKLDMADLSLAIDHAADQGKKTLAGNFLDADVFNGKVLFSSESIKDALLGRSTNHYLNEILPIAMNEMVEHKDIYAEALRLRYVDGIVPQANADQQRLKHAVKSLTRHVNILVIEDQSFTQHDSQRSGRRVDPSSRRSVGYGHSDPTGDLAIALIEHPELKPLFEEELSLQAFLGGAGYVKPA